MRLFILCTCVYRSLWRRQPRVLQNMTLTEQERCLRGISRLFAKSTHFCLHACIPSCILARYIHTHTHTHTQIYTHIPDERCFRMSTILYIYMHTTCIYRNARTQKALTEMGHPIRDDMLFDMLRSNDGERSEVSFDKFLQLCRTNISDEGGGGWGKQRRIRKDLAEAWEAAGGKRDLTGEVDARSLKRIFDLFELKTGVESLISADTSMVEYAEFCALLERWFCVQHVYMFVLFLFWKREDSECSTIAKSPETAEGDVIQTRSIATPDMRRPFEVCVCVCVCVCVVPQL